MTSLIKKYHNLLVEYQLCTSNDTDFGIECFTVIARAVMMDIIQERKSCKYVDGLNISDIQKTMIKYTHFKEFDIYPDDKGVDRLIRIPDYTKWSNLNNLDLFIKLVEKNIDFLYQFSKYKGMNPDGSWPYEYEELRFPEAESIKSLNINSKEDFIKQLHEKPDFFRHDNYLMLMIGENCYNDLGQPIISDDGECYACFAEQFVKLLQRYQSKDVNYTQIVLEKINEFINRGATSKLGFDGNQIPDKIPNGPKFVNLVNHVKLMLESDEELGGLFDEFNDKYTSKGGRSKEQISETPNGAKLVNNIVASNSEWTPGIVADLMAKIALKYISLFKLNYNSPKKEDIEKLTDEQYRNCNFDGIRVIDPGSGQNRLTNAIIDNCVKLGIHISYLRGYEYDLNIERMGEVLLMRKLYHLYKNTDYLIQGHTKLEGYNPYHEIQDQTVNKITQDLTMKIEPFDYLKMSDLLEDVDLTICNPPFGDYDKNNKDPCLKFINVAVQHSKISVFIVPKVFIAEKRGTDRKSLIDNILNLAYVAEVIDLGPAQRVFGKAMSDVIILVLLRKDAVEKLDEESKKYFAFDLNDNYKYFNFKKYADCMESIPHQDIKKWKNEGLKMINNILNDEGFVCKSYGGKIKFDVMNEIRNVNINQGQLLQNVNQNQQSPKQKVNVKTKNITGLFELKKKEAGKLLATDEVNMAEVLYSNLEGEYVKMKINQSIEYMRTHYMEPDCLEKARMIKDSMWVGLEEDILNIIPTRFLEVLSAGLDINRLTKEPVLLSDYFEMPDKQKSHKAIENDENGNYPLIGASMNNNGIIGYLNTWDYENCFTVGKDGAGAGYMFYHNYKFSKISHVYILILKQKLENININLQLITYQLNKIFDWTNALTKNDFKNIKLYLYI